MLHKLDRRGKARGSSKSSTDANRDGSAESVRALNARIRERYGDLPSQIQVAARFLLDNPQEVALLSMREQSRRAAVPAATMTRLARMLGFSGFDEMRAIYVGALRQTIDPFSRRAEGLVLRQREVGEPGISAQMIDKVSASVARLRLARQQEALLEAARLLNASKRVYSVGHRSAFGIAYHFAYLYGYFSTKPVLLDGPGGIGADGLAHCTPNDGLLVVSMEPCAHRSVKIARFARAKGLKVVSVTNSELSPVGRIADVSILVDLRSPSFFDAMTSAFAACEVLVAMIAGLEGEKVPAAVSAREEHSRGLGEWWGDDDIGRISKRLRGPRARRGARISNAGDANG